MKKALVSVAVLLAALTACQKEIGQPEDVIPAPAQMRTISVQAVKTPVTKALELDGIRYRRIFLPSKENDE